MKLASLARVLIGSLTMLVLVEPREAIAASPTVTPLTGLTVPEAVAGSGTVGTFTDPDSAQPASNFSATIDWGDGTTSAGTISGGSGSFSISGNHTYADEGTFVGGLSVHDTNDNVTATGSLTITVTEGDNLSGTGVNFSAMVGVPFSGTVANFTDNNTNNVVGDFTATINWGDGTTTAGTITGGSGAFAVSGAHTYAAAGPNTVTTVLSDDPPGTAQATATSQATVTGPTNTPTNTPTSTPTNTSTRTPTGTPTSTATPLPVVPALNESGMLIFGILIAAAGLLLLIRRR